MNKLSYIIPFALILFLLGCGEGIQNNQPMEFKMEVVDVFNISTYPGPTVTGKIEKGKVVLGQKLILISDGIETVVEVTGLEKFQSTNLQEIESGPDDVGITIRGVTYNEIKRGDILKTNR